MKIIFIESASAFTTKIHNYNSNILIVDEKNNQKLLIDCGSDARHALHELGYTYKDITNIYISHQHADHVGGLEWLALSLYFDNGTPKPNLYANEQVIKNLWKKTLAGGMDTIVAESANLNTFFNTHVIPQNGTFFWNGILFQTIQTVHVMSGYSLMPSYGLFFEINGKKIFLTTDTQFMPHLYCSFYHEADVIFHDCETLEKPSGVHANFKELSTLDADIKKKIWLYHYNDTKLPDAKKHGFQGFVSCRQTFEY